MASTHDTPLTYAYDFDAARLDLSQLVGYEMRLFSDQFPGKELHTKAIAVSDRQIHVESGQRFGDLENLVNHQTVVVQFMYRGQDISVKAKFQRSNGGRCLITLGETVTPLRQRRFCRIPMSVIVRLANYPVTGWRERKLNQLRWIETSSLNFSSGGLMIVLPSPLDKSSRLLLNVNPHDIDFPALVLGRVCHCYQGEDMQYRIGIEFITSETVRRTIPPARISGLPQALFTYDRSVRDEVNRIVLKWANDGQGESLTGDSYEG